MSFTVSVSAAQFPIPKISISDPILLLNNGYTSRTVLLYSICYNVRGKEKKNTQACSHTHAHAQTHKDRNTTNTHTVSTYLEFKIVDLLLHQPEATYSTREWV